MNQPYLESGEKSQSYVFLDNSNKPVDHYEQIVYNLQASHKHLFIDTYNNAPIHLGNN